MFITAGMIAQFNDFAVATSKLQPAKTKPAAKVAPLLTAAR